MHSILVVLVAELVDSHLPTLKEISGALHDVACQRGGICVVVARVGSGSVKLQCLGDVAALQSFFINWQAFQNIKDSLNNLEGRERVVMVRFEPSLKE